MFGGVKFELVGCDHSLLVYREVRTDVLYLVFLEAARGGLTVMCNSDGTPLLYSDWIRYN